MRWSALKFPGDLPVDVDRKSQRFDRLFHGGTDVRRVGFQINRDALRRQADTRHTEHFSKERVRDAPLQIREVAGCRHAEPRDCITL